MAENKEHFRHIMLFCFRKGKNASQTQKKIRAKDSIILILLKTIQNTF